MNLSVVVLAKNSQESLQKTLKSIQFADEIIVIDDNSSDDTVKIAQKHQAKVIQHALNHDYATQRNIGLSQAKAEWVLFVDSDEIVTPRLQSEIKQAVIQTHYQGFLLNRQDYAFGSQLKFGETAAVTLLRLGRKDAGVWTRAVHEYWDVKGNVGRLENPIKHYPHTTLEKFIDKLNFYTEIEAQIRYQAGETFSIITLLTYPIGKFIWNYFLRQGFRDGMPGLIIAWGMSLHSFLVRVKLYEKTH